jgi:copper chaperone
MNTMLSTPETIELTIPDMSCGHCVATITRLVTERDEQARIDADLGTKRVKFSTRIPAAELNALLDEEGYTPQ